MYYSMSVWALSDFTGPIAAAANATQTQPNFAINTITSLNASAVQQTVSITDDDALFQDAFQETGALSVLTNPLTINGQTFAAGSNVELEFTLETTSGVTFYIGRIGTGTSNSGSNQFVYTLDTLQPGFKYQFCGGNDGFRTPYPICFTEGTLIETQDGLLCVEELVAGCMVMTKDNGFQPIAWIGHSHIESTRMVHNEGLRPVIIRRGALGNDLPSMDLCVSQQHRVCVEDTRLGDGEKLVAAKALINGDTVILQNSDHEVTYYHIMCETHELVKSNDQWTETLLPGPQALKTLRPAQYRELLEIFPDIMTGDMLQPVRPIVRVGEYRREMKLRA